MNADSDFQYKVGSFDRHLLVLFWTQGLPDGVISDRTYPWSVRMSVCLFVFEYLRDC